MAPLMSREPKAVQHAIESPEIHASIGYRQAAEVSKRLDLSSARIQLLAGLSFERIEHRMAGRLDPERAEVGESAIGICLPRVFTVAVRENHSVSDHRRLRLVHIARHPGRRQLKFTVLLFHFECHNGAMRDRSIGNWNLEIGMHGAPER